MRTRHLSFLLAASALAACDTAPPASPRSRPQPPPFTAAAPRRALPAQPPTQQPDESPQLSPASGADDYVRAALARNPAIHAAAERVGLFAARVDQVTSLDDPMLRVVPLGEMAETAAGQVGLMTSLSQRLPFPGKLHERGRIAEQDVAAAKHDLQAARVAVARDTRRAFWSYDYVSRAIAVIGAERVLLQQIQRIAEARLAAGSASQQDVLRASVELSGLENQLALLRQRRTSAAAMLARLLDLGAAEEPPAPSGEPGDHPAPQLDALLARAATGNPELARLREEVQGARERLALARLERWPDLSLELAYNTVDASGLAPAANGKDQWWIGLGVNLPIHLSRRDAAEEEARRAIRSGMAQLSDAQNRVAYEVQDALARLEASRTLVGTFRDSILPDARQAVESAESGYRAGSVDFQTLVDDWRQLLEHELSLERSRSDLEQDYADLLASLGIALETGGRESQR